MLSSDLKRICMHTYICTYINIYDKEKIEIVLFKFTGGRQLQDLVLETDVKFYGCTQPTKLSFHHDRI